MSATRTSPKGKGRPAPRKPGPERRSLVLPIALGFIVLLGGIAVLVSRSGSDDGGGGDSTTVPTGVEQTRQVTITGPALTEYTSDGEDAAVGTRAPVASGSTFDGSPITIGDAGRPQLVFFVAHWCPHCQDEVPVISQWIDDNGMPEGVDLKAVSTGVNSDAPNYPPSAWLDREGWEIDTLADDADSSTGAAFGLSGYPFFVAIDARGEVVARASGELSVDQIEALVEAATS